MMDAPDWARLSELVDEFGCGPVKFYLREADDSEDLEVTVDDIAVDDDENIRVVLI
jgi:hypothetical protein